MALTIVTASTLNHKCLIVSSHQNIITNKYAMKSTSLPPLRNPHRSLTVSKLARFGRAIAGYTIFSTIASDPAMAAQQLTEVPEGDNRGLAVLLPIIPAIVWVLYNILEPALNQINRMRAK